MRTFTVKELLPDLSDDLRMVLGKNIASSFRAKHQKDPEKENHGNIIVNVYPEEFRPQAIKISKRFLNRYRKTILKTMKKKPGGVKSIDGKRKRKRITSKKIGGKDRK